MEFYQSELYVYKRWQDAKARATPILVGSIFVAISMDVVELPPTQLMWERLRAHYHLTSDDMYLSVAR